MVLVDPLNSSCSIKNNQVFLSEDNVSNNGFIIIIIEFNTATGYLGFSISGVNEKFFLVADVQVVYLIPNEHLDLCVCDGVDFLNNYALLKVLAIVQFKQLSKLVQLYF
jgi:hypothetical protein